ncbi:MAG: aspartyl/asparaginyl beta-hydroxylase domain-containing protein [Rhodanobacter sp.]
MRSDEVSNEVRERELAALRSAAVEALQQGDVVRAEQIYSRLLSVAPEHAEALQFVAARHFERGDPMRAVAMLLMASQARPDDPTILHQLGAAQSAAGDWRGSVDNLKKCLSLAPHLFLARLRLGMALEQLDDRHGALVAYFSAVNLAQASKRWMSDDSTPPGLRQLVRHAIGFIDKERSGLFHAVLEPLRQRYGWSELKRVEECLAIYLGEQSPSLPDPRQAPKFLYFPGVPSQPYYARERFPWQVELEAHTAMIREELRAVLSGPKQLESFLLTDSPQDSADLLRSSGPGNAAWDAYFFYRHGERYGAHAETCPRTMALLDALPLVRVREHSPEALFSVLRPGSHILPHRGVTNTRLVTHLPLIVPTDCALRVGGDIHEWKEGRCVTFDDTFEHEAWNHSGETRVVLIVDAWNPDLSEAERAAVTDLVAAIGDFNRECELPTPKG